MPRPNRPNMFTAIRTDNPKLISELRKVQEAAVEDNYDAKDYIVPLAEAHVTLSVFELLDMRQEAFLIQEFQRSLAGKKSELLELDKKLEFCGLGCFGDKILYAKPIGGTDFLKCAHDILEKVIYDNNSILKTYGYPTYNPHITMFRKPWHATSYNNVDLFKLSDQFYNTTFGTHQATTIQLCKMRNRMSDGYWQVISQFDLSQ